MSALAEVRRSGRRPAVQAAAVLLILLTITTLVGTALLRRARTEERSRREEVARQVTDAIDRRQAAYAAVLSGLRALFETEARPSHAREQAFLTSLQVRARYPGVRVLSYAQAVESFAVPAALREAEADAAGLGYPRPRRTRAAAGRHMVITYLDPVRGNESIFGFDLLREPRRARAIDETRETGRPAVSAPVRLVQAGHPLGFLMVLAVRPIDRPLTSAANGRLRGVVSAAFDARAFFTAALSAPGLGRSGVEVRDAGLGAGAPPLVRTRPELLRDARLRSAPRTIQVGKRRWRVTVASRATDSAAARLAGWLVLAVGGLCSLLAARLTLGQGQARRAAHALASRMTQDLAEEQRFTAALLESLEEGVVACDATGRLTLFNRASRDIHGLDAEAIPPDDWSGHYSLMAADGSAPLDPDAVPLRRALRGEHVQRAEMTVAPPHGEPRVVQTSGRPIVDDAGAILGAVVSMQDVTARTATERSLREAEERFRRAFEDAGNGMAIVGNDPADADRILDVNAALCALLGYPESDLLGMRLSELVHPEDLPGAAASMRELLEDHVTTQVELRLVAADADVRWTLMTTSLVRDASDAASYRIVQVQDVTERKRYEGQLQHLADHDSLTGLINRRRFEHELERELAGAQRYGTRGAVLVCDLDNFKYVNDTLGHSAGDELLVTVADILGGRLREVDVLGRLGGDEFAVILTHVDAAEAEAVAEDLVRAVRREASVTTAKGTRRTSVSVGIALMPTGEDDVTAEDLLVEADIAMYDAKEGGRDGVAVYDAASDRHARLASRLTWTERLRTALDHGDFTLDAQPILSLTGRAPARFELLVRMVDETGDRIPPGTFLYVAERSGLIRELDRWVLREAIRQLAHCQRLGAAVVFEVNVSARSIEDATLVDFIARELAATGADPAGLVLEITETAAIVNIDRARRFAQRLGELGCGFALDDFGSGFASFYYLKHLAFDILKIDGEFIRNLATSPTDQLVVKSVVDIARGLDRLTVAEYVEDQATLDLLRELGVDFAQGFHVGRPAPIAEAVLRPAPDPPGARRALPPAPAGDRRPRG